MEREEEQQEEEEEEYDVENVRRKSFFVLSFFLFVGRCANYGLLDFEWLSNVMMNCLFSSLLLIVCGNVVSLVFGF